MSMSDKQEFYLSRAHEGIEHLNDVLHWLTAYHCSANHAEEEILCLFEQVQHLVQGVKKERKEIWRVAGRTERGLF